MPPILLLHAAATLLMVGMIWLIQLVHYPLFDRVGAESFTAYHNGHTSRITPLVGVVMLVELGTLIVLIIAPPPGVPRAALWLGAGLLLLIWFMTAFVNSPQHTRLAAGYDPDLVRALVTTNWVRTLAWSGRGLLVVWLLAR